MQSKNLIFLFRSVFFRDISPFLLQNRYFCDIIQFSMLSHFVRCEHSYRTISAFTTFDISIHIVRYEHSYRSGWGDKSGGFG